MRITELLTKETIAMDLDASDKSKIDYWAINWIKQVS